MELHGCQIASVHSTDPASDGWLTTVTRGQETRGPFTTIAEAVQCAKTWNKQTLVELSSVAADVNAAGPEIEPPTITK